MTVRAWFTISALVLAALVAAFAFRLFSPAPPADIIVRAGEVRLDGSLQSYCWPQRGDRLRCDETANGRPDDRVIPATGEMRFLAAYPVQPQGGLITITAEATGRHVMQEAWTDSMFYDLPPGIYDLDVIAEFAADAEVRYLFRFTITRPGD